jgi:hypothetical protein
VGFCRRFRCIFFFVYSPQCPAALSLFPDQSLLPDQVFIALSTMLSNGMSMAFTGNFPDISRRVLVLPFATFWLSEIHCSLYQSHFAPRAI